jgi:hypothetical protein
VRFVGIHLPHHTRHTIDLDSNATMPDQYLTGRELLDLDGHTFSLSDSRWSYHVIARTMALRFVSNHQMRRQYSLSQDAFRSIHSKLVHLLTVCELARVQVGYLSSRDYSVDAIVDDPLSRQSVYASLSIYCLTALLYGRVDTDALDRLIGVKPSSNWIPNLMDAERWVYMYWGHIRTLASPNFPLAMRAPRWIDIDEVDQLCHCLSSVLMEQAGIFWRPCQDEQNLRVSQQHQQHELIALSIWRQLGVDIYEFSAWRRGTGYLGCRTYLTSMARCQVCGVHNKLHRQDGVWCCHDQCRQIDVPLDMQPLPGSK